MCGFVTIYNKNQRPVSQQQLLEMTRVIAHRGPDDERVHVSEHVGLGFRRLSIIDLNHGAQPLRHPSKDIWVTFNGEIYNYQELRQWLIGKGHTFHTQSDTEVIVHLYEEVGTECPKLLRGMFSFVIWDKEQDVLFGARDPFGVKPLYWTETPEGFIFGSEIKSLLLAEKTKREVDVTSFYHYLTFQYVPEPGTMFQNISKLQAGHLFLISEDKLMMEPYYSVTFNPDEEKPLSYFVEGVRDILQESVSIHRISDVSRGAFLSGGIDSSSLVSLLQKHEPTQTFSVGFDMFGYSELEQASSTAQYLGTDHHEICITSQQYLSTLPKIIWHMDEPVADPSAIGLYFVSQLASNFVKVVFSGEGADEFFGGYNIYGEPHSLRHFQYLPAWLKILLRKFANVLPEGMKGKSFLERGAQPLEQRFFGNAKIFTEEAKQQILGFHLNKLEEPISSYDVTKPLYERAHGYDEATKMQYIDIHTWLRGDILMKADKMSMAHSLELRVPFIDKKVFELAAAIPTKYKLSNSATKFVLREAMKDILPPSVQHRRKLGFPVPIRVWLRGEFYGWAKEVIHSANVENFINKSAALQMLEQHKEGKIDYSRKLWTIIIFIIWHQIYMEGGDAALIPDDFPQIKGADAI
ncbi:asparagine synthase (glutamine-hydrolyzing) [Aneurinibacillus tyrosinisolvens]|uniref:asparagine synthase (glutamine-hydrolyzing) n=1 Tax=Aneurinibacillus tyrosinisolvens TaxID=1443435 RepID=UPI00063F4A87|nr:asparagine synthase (glutamine-hydrolyzing) [Aneurinibacillus tyrosinisolvens]